MGWGEADRIVTPAYGKEYAAAIPGAGFRVMPRSGQLPQLETPQALLPVLTEFGGWPRRAARDARSLSWRARWRAPCSVSGPRPTGTTLTPGKVPRPLLPGELGGAGLADHGDADLAGVGQLLLDLLGDVAGDHLRLDVVDSVRLDHDPDLAA